MNKSPMEVRFSEETEKLLDEAAFEHDKSAHEKFGYLDLMPRSDGFKAGARWFAELPEVKALLEIAEAVSEINDDECYFDHHGYCQAHNLEEDCHVGKAKEALKAWKSFKGE